MNSLFRCTVVFFCLVHVALASTQSGPTVQADRVAAHPDLRATTMLRGHVPAWAVGANDRGATPADTPLRLTFVLSRSAEVQASFTQLLADQQDPSSPSYHQWLTPQQVGERYGPTQHDLDMLTSWLGSQGLTVIETTPSRVFISVAAPASAVASALATSFHMFNDNGEPRVSSTVEPSIPSAFASIVSSIAGLADSAVRPMHRAVAVPMTMELTPGEPEPLLTSGASHFITPGDFATIFDLKPVYNAGFSGAGQKVAIIGRSRVLSTDITQFESKTGLPTNLPNTIVPPNGADPQIVANGDAGEATLDVERVIGTAPAVLADLVVSSVNAGGILTAAQYEVQTLLDPVMTISFGACEINSGPSQVSLWDTLFSQAASEGISVFVSSGDSAAATCDSDGAAPFGFQLRSINYICASSYATCVGGTELVEGANPSQYWSTNNGTGLASALSYIPEGVWNEPTSGPSGIPFVVLGGGGGASIYVPKPSWQVGAGVPADNARDVPDVSFPSAGHDGYFICSSQVINCANGFAIFFGTSAAAPGMAGVTALLNQKMGGSQGNLNPLLYRLAASNPGVFHDATPASSGVPNCSINTASVCNNSLPSSTSTTGGLAGYALTTGYDQATGWGSLDVANFLTAAAAVPKTTLASTVLAVQESASLIANTQSVTFTATLTSKTGGAPSGTVQFYANGNTLGVPVALVSGRAVTAPMPFPAAGSYDISATYSGDNTFASTTAPGIALTVTGLASLTKVTIANPNIPVGTTQVLNLSVTPSSGTVVPTGVVRVSVVNANGSVLVTVPLSNGIGTTPPIPFPVVGNTTVTASYQGDTAFSPSNSSTLAVTVQRISSTIQLSAVSGDIGTGGGKTFNALINSVINSTAPAPTGLVQLFSNGISLGNLVVIAPNLTQTQSSQVTFPFQTFLTSGTYTITAVYAGDSNWLPSTSSGISINVLSTPASYQVTVSSPTLSIAAGATTGNTAAINVPGFLGFGGTVLFKCSVTYNGSATLTDAPTCSLLTGGVSVIPTSAPAFTVLTIITTTPREVKGHSIVAKDSSGRSGGHLPGEIAVCALLLCLVPPRRKTWRALAVLLVFAAGFNTLSGCSSGGGSSGPPPVLVGTTTGNYTVTITPSSNSPGVATPAPVTIALTVN